MQAKDKASRSSQIREVYKAHPKFKTQEVIDELKAKGVEVSSSLVSVTKTGMTKRKNKLRFARMQKKSGIEHVAEKTNRSQMVRDLALEHPEYNGVQIERVLQGRGVTVSRPVIYEAMRALHGKGRNRPKGRTKGLNRSALIREALAQHPEFSVDQVREALQAEGVKVEQYLVRQVRSKLQNRDYNKKPAQASANGHSDLLGAAMQFIRAAGGLARAQEAMATLGQLQDMR